MKQISIRRWVYALIATSVLVFIVGPWAVFRVTSARAGKRLVDEVVGRMGEIDPPGSDDHFPECYGALLDSFRGVMSPLGQLDAVCIEYDSGKRLPRSQMPATCRGQLEVRRKWAEQALACADGWPAAPRLPALEWLSSPSREEIVFVANQVVRRGIRHGLKDAKVAGDADRASALCAGLLRFNHHFDHLDWLTAFGTSNLAADTECAWAAENAGPEAKQRLHDAATQALVARPTEAHQLEDYLLWTRARTYGGFASAAELGRVPPRLRPLFDAYRLPDFEIPELTEPLTRLEWLEFDRRARQLVSHGSEADGDFELSAREVSRETAAWPLPDMSARVSTLRDTYRLLRSQRERRHAIEKLKQLTAP